MSPDVKRLPFVLVLAAAALTFSQCSKKLDDPDIIARVGDKEISVEEFRTRFSFTPHLGRYPSLEAGKGLVLASLIGEKVLAQEAERLGIDRDPGIELFARQIEDEALVEALFEEEVGSKVQVSEEELREAYFKSKQELEIEYLTFDDEKQAQAAYEQISLGKDFEQVARELLAFGGDGITAVPKKTIKWGQADPRLEDVAFQLQPGQVSQPVTIDGVSLLLHLVNRKTDIFTTEEDFNYWRPSLEKRLRRRKKEAMFKGFLAEVMGDTKLRVSGQAFAAVVKELERAADLNERWAKAKGNKPQPVDQGDVELASEQLEDLLDRPFAQFSDGRQWTVREFLQKLRVGPYPLNYRSRRDFVASLREVIGRMAEIERLAQEGRQRGLDRSQYVRRELAMWRDSIVAQTLRKRLMDTVQVAPEEVQAYYQQHRHKYGTPERVKVQEILVYDRNLADSLVSLIRAGADMGQLARRFSKRTATASKGGVSPYLVRNAWGKLGEVAFQAKVGELVGPVEVAKNHWSIFRVLEHTPENFRPLDQVRKQVEEDALKDKRQRVLESFLVDAVKQYRLEVNRAALDSARVIDANMWVLKTHFPGRTIAPNVFPLDPLMRWRQALRPVLQK
jgi:parvulin-like peptidyl-prolyl isomerase